MFMEVRVGFHPEDPKRDGKMKVYEDGLCFLRNYSAGDYIDEHLNPVNFISSQAQMLSHENLHLILLEEVSEEAFEGLNSVDGFCGYLVPRTTLCYFCGQLIPDDGPCVATLGCYWHKECLGKCKDIGSFERIFNKVHVMYDFEDGPVKKYD